MSIEAFASIALVVVTMGGLGLTVLQLRDNRRSQNVALARRMWNDYLKTGLENPDLGTSETAVEYLEDVGDLRALALGETLGAQRYHWFVTIVLDTCNALLEYIDEEDWTNTVENQLVYHKSFLRMIWRENLNDVPWAPFYSERIQKIVDKLIAT